MSDHPIPSNPWSHLPTEINQRIFVLCHNELQKKPRSSNEVYNPRRAPLCLASVCQHWRQIALNTSELWAKCWLSYTHPELNELWLSRAGNRQLDLDGTYLYLPRKEDFSKARFERTKIGPLLASIEPYLPHCQTLRFELPLNIDTRELLPNYTFAVPNLESCALLCGSQSTMPDVPSWMLNLVNVLPPKIQNLDLDWDERRLDALLPNLVSLGIKYEGRTQLRHILSMGQNLRTLNLKGRIGEHVIRGTEILQYPIINQTLTQLDITTYPIYDANKILDAITAPSLTSLRLRITKTWNMDGNPYPFLTFIERSQCAIEELRVSIGVMDSYIQPALIHPLIRTSLKGLHCSNTPVSPQFIRFLSDTSNLPCLTTLVLRLAHINSDIVLSSIGDMVLARRGLDEKAGWHGSAKLQTFGMSFGSTNDGIKNPSKLPVEARRIRKIADSTKGEGDPLVIDHLWDEF